MSVAVEPEQLVWPEMDDLLPCDGFLGEPIPCPHPAQWIIWRACCADKLKCKLHCTQHKDELLLSEEGIVCQFCETPHIPARLIVSYVEPLNGMA